MPDAPHTSSLDALRDDELVTLCLQAGRSHEVAFEALYRRYAPRVLGFLVKVTSRKAGMPVMLILGEKFEGEARDRIDGLNPYLPKPVVRVDDVDKELLTYLWDSQGAANPPNITLRYLERVGKEEGKFNGLSNVQISKRLNKLRKLGMLEEYQVIPDRCVGVIPLPG